MMKKGGTPAPTQKPVASKAPPRLKPSPEQGPMKVMAGNPFDGAQEEMMAQMGGSMPQSQGPDVVVNGEPLTSPEQIAEFVMNTPEILQAVQAMMASGEEEGEGDM